MKIKVNIQISLLAILLGCSSGTGKIAEPDPENLRTEFAATEVQIMEAEKRPFVYYIHSNGKIIAGNEVHIQLRTSGLIENINVQEGDLVKKGKLLASLDDQDQKLNLKKAEAELKQRQLEYESQLLGLGARQDSINKNDLIENIRILSGLTTAEIGYEEALLEFNKTFVRAPLSGVVSDIGIQSGNHASLNQELCVIYNPGNLMVKTEVLETDFEKLKDGLNAAISPVAADSSYNAIIDHINPRVSENGTLKVTLRIKTPMGLVPGMNVQVKFSVPYSENLIVPKSALVIRSGKEVVFVEENGLAKWKYVTSGLENGEEIEIIDGLNPGANVITSNNLQLAHDAPVSVIEN